MAGAKDIKRRIKSISGTKKITKAMEMISAVKMRRATAQTLALRSYADTSREVFFHLARRLHGDEHVLLQKKEKEGKTLYIVITANRGLCGGFNTNVIKKVRSIARPGADVIGIGVKGERLLKKFGFNIVASFSDTLYVPSTELMRPIVEMAIDGFKKDVYSRVVLVSTEYRSTLSSAQRTETLLPFNPVIIGIQTKKKEESALYKIEPDSQSALDFIIPRIMEALLYRGVLDSRAAEESARMLAMKSASDAAGDMTDGLRRSYNKARQMKITQEISEISAGRLALE